MQDTDPCHPASQAAASFDAQALAFWLRLEQTPGVGPATARRLLDHFHSPQAIFDAGQPALRQHVSERIATALSGPPDAALSRHIDTALDWLGASAPHPRHLLHLGGPGYPPLLAQLAAPPLLLYAAGRAALLSAPALAIVGSRNATVQGVANAGAFGAALSAAGLTIVSGLALGIDAAAHEGGLRGPGATVAVIGTGIDRIYPQRNAALARRIAQEGCIVSEYALGTGPIANNFPRRNRIISGLCAGVLVVEVAAQSGSLITAHVAIEQGRDVFAIPGSIHAPLAKGCHALIRAGAKLVDCADDILGELQLTPMAGAGASALAEYRGDHLALLHALGYGPVDADTLAALTDIDPGFLASQLLSLELAGHVERLPGGLYQRLQR